MASGTLLQWAFLSGTMKNTWHSLAVFEGNLLRSSLALLASWGSCLGGASAETSYRPFAKSEFAETQKYVSSSVEPLLYLINNQKAMRACSGGSSFAVMQAERENAEVVGQMLASPAGRSISPA